VQLNRSIGLVRATAMVVGIIVGASIFVQPSEITRRVPDERGILLVWLLAGLLTLFGALVCAELSSAFPRSGGVYVFLKEAWSPAAGFLWGWAMFWSMHSGIVAAVAVVVGRFGALYLPVDATIIAIGAIVLLSLINYAGVRHGSALQTLFTIAKLAAIGVLLIVVVRAPATHATAASSIRFQDLVLALSAGLFTYGGWHMVTYAADETHEPQKTIPRALMLGVAIVTACYLALNAAYMRVLPLEKIVSSQHIAADVATQVLGAKWAAALNVLVIVSALGALAGIILAGPRVYYAMAQDGLLFRWIGAVHPRFRTPHLAIALQAVWSSVLVATGTYRSLFTRVVYTEWIFFAAMAAGILVLRRRAGYAPRYRVFAFVPLLFIAASIVIVGNQIAAEPVESAIGLLLVVAGLPVYFLWTRKVGAVADAGH
jgi:APA family basic amino acid/polyamine antiporter